MQSNLNVSVSELKDGYQVITFDGEFDKAGHSNVSEVLDGAVKSFDGKNLIFDFSKLKFINSEGIGYLMEIHSHLVKKDKKLVIVGPNDHVDDVFKTIGITEIVPVFKNLDSFLNN
jgi:anti-anti-sigma factor